MQSRHARPLRRKQFWFFFLVSLLGGWRIGQVTGASSTSSVPEQGGDDQPPSVISQVTKDDIVEGGSGTENKFLKYLFNKYGSKGVISFEGLEHLMHSLGLGGLDFSPSHTLDEHRPEGFRTEDLVESPFVENEPKSGEATGDHSKVAVSFGVVDADNHDHETHSAKPRSSAENSTDNPTPTKVVPRDSTVYHHLEESGLINSSDQIRIFNEVSGPEDSSLASPENSKTTATVRHSSTKSSDDDNNNAADQQSNKNKWHNEIWQEIIFKEIHGAGHHYLKRDDRRKTCLSPMSMVHLILEEPQEDILQRNFNFELSPNHRHRRALPHSAHHDHSEEFDHEVEEIIAARIKITPPTFKDLCPALLAQIEQRACFQQNQKHDPPHIVRKEYGYAWLYATICVTIISICGLTGVAMVPLSKSVAYDEILRFLVACAVGTLCGDALMHLLPHAMIPHEENTSSDDDHSHDHGHSNEPVWLCFCAFLSALFMYSLETILPMLRSGEPGSDGHHHGHSHSLAKVAPAVEPPQHRRNTNAVDDIELDLQDVQRKELNTMLEKKKPVNKPLSPVAFMVILGDGLHNVTDGLAIGAAFAADPVTGMATSLAILCHELPHELGDFALLLQTGVSIRRAMFLNIVSSVLSFIGMFIGLLVTSLHESVVRWIYAGTAGTFLYIALADLVPEMNKDLSAAPDGNQNPNTHFRKMRIAWSQISGILLGGMIMLAIALNEDHLKLLFE
ncbi:zinc transporter ZIP10 [Uranotaenia lowii]|uniref:zinc transporter ZIP10 n=1 Tax=Uranotaenia lowii TaxID=190385 RepID=UPI002478A693|nr:zinc transporter ZIP10 [Uranotaenia lowii]XP_055591784.1 zinc transporter ZIP10 [Uranotaenia lowii]XP_055591785.1 zinc transporter ZIP10 [Uranotaenia lowii]XP_055591786.1 zinc transporter ZIP10 [Uranotaenia lowii]XP_055591787.1 zinc transporter ZIP10 [Uranotaenia lowii]XP_055591788.1 zinc transporter ZIP10 [Uranotaenia lowii]XP_055591789.1 zinc transporter ZIP10 [Uranotaenia lowii]